MKCSGFKLLIPYLNPKALKRHFSGLLDFLVICAEEIKCPALI